MTETTDWVVLELSRQGDKELPEDLAFYIQKSISKPLEVFVPARSFYRRENAVTIRVLEGYAFVRAGYSPGVYIELENSPYVTKVLSTDSKQGRYLQYVEDIEIQKMTQQLDEQSIREIEVEDEVSICSGVYEGLQGIVKGMDDVKETAYVEILNLTSLNTYVPLPVQFLTKDPSKKFNAEDL
jgi:transcription antitermination factor NusG